MEILRKIIFVFICVFPFLGTSQIAFKKKYTSGPFDQGNGLTQLPDSSYAVTGASGGFDQNSGQAFLMIVDSLGNQKWTKDYGGYGDDIGVKVIHVPGDGFFIAGYSGSTSNGDFDFVVYKTDEQGDLQWEKMYGTSDWEKLHDAVLLSDGGLMLVGQTEGQLSQGKDIFIVRTDDQGVEEWREIIQTPQDDVAFAIDTLSSTHVVIGGDMGDFGISKGMIMSYNINGTQEWVKIYHNHGVAKVRDVVVFNNHIYLIGGLYDANMEQYNRWYSRGDLNGDYVSYWVNYYSGNSIFTAGAIRDNSGVYLGLISDAVDINPYPGGNDAFLLKMHVQMYYSGFSTPFSAFDEDIINEIIVTSDGGIALVGNASDDPISLSLGTDVMLVKIGPNDEVEPNFDSGLDLVSLTSHEKKTIAIYPNPTCSDINIPSELENKVYELRNVQGQVVKTGRLTAKIAMNKLETGIYFLNIKDENQIWSAKILKK